MKHKGDSIEICGYFSSDGTEVSAEIDENIIRSILTQDFQDRKSKIDWDLKFRAKPYKKPTRS